MAYAVDDDSPRVLRHPAENQPIVSTPMEAKSTILDRFKGNILDRFKGNILTPRPKKRK